MDLPRGWSSPPGGYTLAIIFALDQLGDPPAGLYSMMLAGNGAAPGSFVFRAPPGEPPIAGIRARSITADSRTLREIADEAASALGPDVIEVTRGRLPLPAGTVRFLEWEQPIRWGSIHMRAYFFGLGGGVARIDIGTSGPPGPSLERELRRILESARASGG